MTLTAILEEAVTSPERLDCRPKDGSSLRKGAGISRGELRERLEARAELLLSEKLEDFTVAITVTGMARVTGTLHVRDSPGAIRFTVSAIGTPGTTAM